MAHGNPISREIAVDYLIIRLGLSETTAQSIIDKINDDEVNALVYEADWTKWTEDTENRELQEVSMNEALNQHFGVNL